MKVVILSGGMGTRLREETEHKPKPMVEIGGMPILWHIMKLYSTYGYKDFVLCLGYKQAYIRDYFLNYQFMKNDFTINLHSREKIVCHNSHDEDWNITLVDTGPHTKKGTRVKMIEPYIKDERFMLTYGDGIGNVDIKALVDYHIAQKKIVTFTGVNPVSRFATVETDGKGEIVDWSEKKALEGHINAGFFVLERKIFEYLNNDCELEEEPLRKLARERQVSMYKHRGFWQCMDTYRDNQLLQGMWDNGDAPWKIW